MESEVLQLKESNGKLAIQFQKEKTKFDQSVNEQKEQMRKVYEAKQLAIAQSIQSRFGEQLREMEKRLERADEESCIQKRKFVQVKLLFEKIRQIAQSQLQNLKGKAEDLIKDHGLIMAQVKGLIEQTRQTARGIKTRKLRKDQGSKVADINIQKIIQGLKQENYQLVQKLQEKETEMLIQQQQMKMMNEENEPDQMQGIWERMKILSDQIKLSKSSAASLSQLISLIQSSKINILSTIKNHFMIIKQKIRSNNNEIQENQQELQRTKLENQIMTSELAEVKRKIKQFESREIQIQIPVQKQTGQELEYLKKCQQFQLEKNSLQQINDQLTEEIVSLREQAVLLQVENASTSKLLDSLQFADQENQKLCENNKALYNQLIHQQQMIQQLTQANSQIIQQKSQVSLIYNNNSILQNNYSHQQSLPNLTRAMTPSYIQGNQRDQRQVTGTSFIKKVETVMGTLSKKQDKNNQDIIKFIDNYQQKQQFVLNCLESQYEILNENQLQIIVSEDFQFKQGMIDLALDFQISNQNYQQQKLDNFKLICGSAYVRVNQQQNQVLELGPFEQKKMTLQVKIEYMYLQQIVPIYFSYIKNSQAQKLALPITIYKLVQYEKQDAGKFEVIKQLQIIEELALDLDERVVDQFSELTKGLFIKLDEKGQTVGTKAGSMYGSFFVTIEKDKERDQIVVKIHSLYKCFIHTCFCSTLKLFLEILNS